MIKRFLLADDDEDDAMLFREALKDIDPEIICYYALDGREAIHKLDKEEFEIPHIIFLDVNMPGMDGWLCLTRLKEDRRFNHIPVIMYSTSSYKKDADKALELGALCFFTKPNDFKQLKKILEVVASNLNGDLLNAISMFDGIKFQKSFSCS